MITSPPLVHFTTADLSNLADGQRAIDPLVERLERLGAVVLITPEHLVEWLLVAEDSRERRFQLADQFPHVVWADWPSSQIWAHGPSQFSASGVCSGDLCSKFYGEDGTPQEWLLERKGLEVGTGEGDFFARGAQHTEHDPDRAFDVKLLDKYHNQNRKHGSDLSRPWHLARSTAIWLDRASRVVGPLIPEGVKRTLKDKGRKGKRFLDALEPRMHASFHGVTVDNLGFQLWWETRQKLRRRPSEVGGLGERIDLQELRYWRVCSLITLDKRVYSAVWEASRTLAWDMKPGSQSGFVRAGDEAGILAHLDYLLEFQEQQGT